MAVNKDSTGFTLFFAVAMVVVVGAILASLAFSLQPLQKANAADKKRMDILAALGFTDKEVTRANAKDVFSENVKEFYLLDYQGNVTSQDETEVFLVDVKKQHRNTQLTEEDKKFPLYKGTAKDGSQLLVAPVVGKGLWGPIWGYVALQPDMKTIYGATFDHKTETPGLGAEIKTDFFEKNWKGQEFDYTNPEGKFFRVTKGAGSSSGKSQVDGITGGTITSVGVEEMVNRSMAVYKKFNPSTGQLKK